jgi:galactokinase
MREAQADAPGRVNLIGEHTDYHDGWVMPCAIPQRTTARLRERHDRRVHAVSAQRPGEPVVFALGRETRTHSWADYVQGLTWVLLTHGYHIGGFDLDLFSRVPVGSGLSSSASLEVAVLRALRTLFSLPISDVDIAQLGQRAEVHFVGAPVGIMDQMACSLADEDNALFLDTRSLSFDCIPLPATMEMVVIDSGVAHQHAGGDYATRRRESEEAARMLGVEKLRDIDIDRLAEVSRLPEPLKRRARHVITENARVLAARDALAAADLPALGRLLRASHASLSADYEVSTSTLDLLVELAVADERVFGARMTGGGFGGAIVAVVQRGTGRAVGADVVAAYESRATPKATLLVPASHKL